MGKVDRLRNSVEPFLFWAADILLANTLSLSEFGRSGASSSKQRPPMLYSFGRVSKYSSSMLFFLQWSRYKVRSSAVVNCLLNCGNSSKTLALVINSLWGIFTINSSFPMVLAAIKPLPVSWNKARWIWATGLHPLFDIQMHSLVKSFKPLITNGLTFDFRFLLALAVRPISSLKISTQHKIFHFKVSLGCLPETSQHFAW